MVLHAGERWHCTNLFCHCSILIETGTSQEGTNPRCSCGAIMKKEFKSPVFTYLDFLQCDPPLVAAERSERE